VKNRILSILDELSFESHFHVRITLVGALIETECSDAIPILRRIQSLDSDGRVKRAALTGVLTLEKTTESAGLRQMQTTLSQLETDYRKLKDELQDLKLANKM
jgi:hypothetical protein